MDCDDPDGMDPELVERMVPLADRVLSRYFDHDVRGLDRLPSGPALLVGNHNSGAMFVEAIAFGARAYRERPDEQGTWSGLAHDNIIGLPVLGPFLHRLGAIRAGHDAARAAFAAGRKVVVFPGGNREAFRPFRDRYRLGLGDRRGFVRLALRERVPIVPVVFVGGHSGFVVLRDNQRLARLLRAERWLRSDTWPLILGLPWGLSLGPLFHLPLPVGCITEVLEPIPVEPHLDEPEEQAVEALFTQVQTSMQQALSALAAERRSRPWPLRRR